MKILGIKIVKIPAFIVGREAAKAKQESIARRLAKFKTGLAERKQRDREKVNVLKNPSKHTPKGTIAVKKEVIDRKKFVTKKFKKLLFAEHIKSCKKAKLAKAA